MCAENPDFCIELEAVWLGFSLILFFCFCTALELVVDWG